MTSRKRTQLPKLPPTPKGDDSPNKSDVFNASERSEIMRRVKSNRNKSTEYGIDPPVGCLPLIKRLTELGIIKARVMPIDEYSCTIDRDDPKWNEYIFPLDGQLCICDVCMNNKDVQKAKHNLGKHHKATLLFADNKDDDNSMPLVRIEGDKDYVFRRLRTDGHPYKVFNYAVEQKMMRADQKYVSNLFKDQPVITKALSPFVEISTNSFRIKSFSTTITDAQKELIQKHGK